jgi:hypoxanthine phosphoribosyltransferase
MHTISISDKQFSQYILYDDIAAVVKTMAEQLKKDYQGKTPLFLIVLNGAFMFAAELFKHYHEPCQLSFIKLTSYSGTQSSEKVDEIIGLSENIKDRDIVIIEDIVDTGLTMDELIKKLESGHPGSIKIASLLFKPEAFKGNTKPDYTGIQVPNDFIVGFGLDYQGFGRNLTDIYRLV